MAFPGLKDPVQLVLVAGYLSLALIAVLLSNFGQYVPAIFAVVSLALLLTFTARRIFGRQALVIGLFTSAIMAIVALATQGVWLRVLDRLAEQLLGQPLIGGLTKAPSEVAILAITLIVSFAVFALRKRRPVPASPDGLPAQPRKPRSVILYVAMGLFFALGATLIIWSGLAGGESEERPVVTRARYFPPDQMEPVTVAIDKEFESGSFSITNLHRFAVTSPTFDKIPDGAFMLSGTQLRVAPQVLRASDITSCRLLLEFDIENDKNETLPAQLTLAWNRPAPEITYKEVGREARTSGWGGGGGGGKYCGSQMIALQAGHPNKRVRVVDTSERGRWTGFLNREREYKYGCVFVIEEPATLPALSPDCSRQ